MSEVKINLDESNVKPYSLGYQNKFNKFTKADEKLLFDKNALIFQRDRIDDAFKLLKGNEFKVYLFIMRETLGYHSHKSALSLYYISQKTGIPESEISRAISSLKSKPLPFITDHGSYGKDSNYSKVYSINTRFEYDVTKGKLVSTENSSNAITFDGKIPESITKKTELISDNISTTCEKLKSTLGKTSNDIYKEKLIDLKKDYSSSKQQNNFCISSAYLNSFSNSDLFFKGNYFFIPNSFLEELTREIPGLEKLPDDKVHECFKGIDIWLDENVGPNIIDEKFFIGWFQKNRTIQKLIKLVLNPPRTRKRKSKTVIEPLADKMYENFKSVYSYYKDKEFGKYLNESEIFQQRKACQLLLNKIRIDFEQQGTIVTEENILESFKTLLEGLYQMDLQDETIKYYVNKLTPKYLTTEESIAMLEILRTYLKVCGVDPEIDLELSVNNFLQ